MKVRFKKFNELAVTPRYAHNTDAGMDLFAIDYEWDSTKEVYIYKTGIGVEIPDGYVGLIFPRSSVYKKTLSLANCVGVIDSGYRGEIKFMFRLTKEYPGIPYAIGDAIGQLIIIPYPKIEMEETNDLTNSDRGENGFGSSGNN